MDGAVSPKEISRRRNYIESIQQSIVGTRLGRFIGRVFSVLIEERIEGTEIAIGRSSMQAPEVDGVIVVHDVPLAVTPGTRIDAMITGVTEVDLQATYRR